MSDDTRERTVYKLTVLHMDLNGQGPYLQGEKILGDRDFTTVMDAEPHVVQWNDSHPLNQEATQRQAFEALFTPPVGQQLTIYGDTEPLDLIKLVNKALEPHGLKFNDTSMEGADHCVFTLGRADR